MMKFLIFVKQPPDTEVFEDNFSQRYVPAINRMPHVARAAVVRAHGAPRGEPPYYLIHELYFNSQDDLIAALNSPEGREAGAMLMTFAKDLVTMMFAEVWE